MHPLLQPRYLVIAGWPNMEQRFEVGIIITIDAIDAEGTLYTTYGYYMEEFFQDYPHLFRKLNQYEHREESEMPQFVAYKFLQYSKEIIIKVEKHFSDSDGNYNKNIFSIDGIPYSYSKCRVATLEEYTTYLNNKK